MNKILNNLYIFSKLTTTLVLFSLLVFMSYLFYKSYSSQNSSEIDLNDKLTSVINSIENNSQKLNMLKNKAISTDQAINDLKKLSNQSDKFIDQEKFNLLMNENKILKEKINALANKLLTIDKSVDENKISNFEEELSKLLNIIHHKYENGLNVTNEIILLQKFHNKIEYESVFEKLLILSENNFVGLENFYIYFDVSMQKYLNHKFLKENDNPIIKFFSSYIDIRPGEVLDYENLTLKLISQAKNDIEKNNIKKSLKKILSLSDAKPFFKIWIQQAEIYLEFNNTLNQITKKSV